MRSRTESVRGLMALVVVSVSLWAAPAHAQIERYVVRVDGLACPFCAYGLEKKLKALSGASEIEIDLDAGWAAFELQGRPLLPESIREAVQEAGFTARAFTVTARGVVREADAGLTLDLGAGQVFRLEGGRALAALRARVARGRGEVRITGALTETEGAFSLQVDEVQALPEPG